MAKALPGGKEASYRLLGLQALVHDTGVIVKRGTARLFLEGRDTAELLDLLVERTATGRPVVPDRLRVEVAAERRDAFMALIGTLAAHRFLVPAGKPSGPERNREDVFFWNYGTTFADVVGELAAVRLTVFGVNSIGLALLGNLRGCGFRDLAFVDHPALRNLDYYDARHRLRPEIAGALAVPPQPFDKWEAENPSPEGCLVVTCDFGGRPLMRDWNRAAVESGVMFYPVVLLDHVAQLGPLVAPGEGPCYECLWARQNANAADPALMRAGEVEAPAGQRAVGYLQPMARAAADFAAIDLLKHFSGALPGGRIGRIVEVDLLAPATAVRDLLKVPRCPVCGHAAVEAAETEAEEAKAEAPAEPAPAAPENTEASPASETPADTSPRRGEVGPDARVRGGQSSNPPASPEASEDEKPSQAPDVPAEEEPPEKEDPAPESAKQGAA